MNLLSGKCLIVGMVVGIAFLSGCNRHEQASVDSTDAQQRKMAQTHSGKLHVRIIPELPTSNDDLQAVFTGGAAVAWQWEKNGQVIDGEQTPKLTKNRFTRGDTISVKVVAGGEEGKASVTIANSPPDIRSVRFTPGYICRGVDITAVPDGADADGDEMKFGCKWVINGEETSEDTLVLSGDRIKKGDIVSAIITPYDSQGAGKEYRTQRITIPKAAPVFVSVPPVSFTGRVYTYNAAARDPEGDPVTYSLASCPEGMTIDRATGRITWPIASKASGTHAIEVVAQNSEGARAVQNYKLDITLKPGESE